MWHPPSDSQLVATLRALVSLSEVDWFYGDRYLDRAETLLLGICPKDKYDSLRRLRQDLPQLTEELRKAAGASDWSGVRTLADRSAEVKRSLVSQREVLTIADAVYGWRSVRINPTVLALSGILVLPTIAVSRARATILEELALLIRQDLEWSEFYDRRRTHFEGVAISLEAQHPKTTVNATETKRQLLEAIDKGNLDQVKRLADIIANDRSVQFGRVRAPQPSSAAAERLREPLPTRSLARAAELGLAPELLSGEPGLNGYLGCCCAHCVTFPEKPLSLTNRKAEGCTCGHVCPPDVPTNLRENLDLLLRHPFLTSLGTRYLPWFGEERILVETFPETSLDAPTGLLAALGLPARQGLARTTIEHAIRSRNSRICQDLMLDPEEFVVSCIPFDAYARLAPRYGWGEHEIWTHFDGYQNTVVPGFAWVPWGAGRAARGDAWRPNRTPAAGWRGRLGAKHLRGETGISGGTHGDACRPRTSLERPSWACSVTHGDPGRAQNTGDLQLLALVGGDVRYGGPYDLCSLQRDNDTQHLTARFAILRRNRFAVRQALPSPSGSTLDPIPVGPAASIRSTLRSADSPDRLA